MTDPLTFATPRDNQSCTLCLVGGVRCAPCLGYITQRVNWLQAMRRSDGEGPPLSFKGWLGRAIHHVIIIAVKQERRA